MYPQLDKFLIKACNLSITRQQKPILKDVSIAVGFDDFITIVGPNGAGKSLLLQCLMGIFVPDEGSVIRKKKLQVGYMPQRFLAKRTMPISVKRFLSLGQKIGYLPLEEVIEQTQINAIVNKQLFNLSGGELQRVLLARSLLRNPQLLVLDEPAQNLDISGQLEFYKLLKRIFKERNLSILMVSHDLHTVMAATKKVICLFHHVCCSGEPHAVAKDPEFAALFGNDMAEMMAIYQHNHNHTHGVENV